nr:hypothetical protein [Candidatus Peribacteraceae bacterium]
MDDIRLQKLKRLRELGIMPYAANFTRTHVLAEGKDLPEGTEAKICGRIVLLRDMGKMTFLTLQDHTGRFQVLIRQEDFGENYDTMLSLMDLGDFIGVGGTRITTKTGEPTLQAKAWVMLSKALSQPPEKWHGVQNQEVAWRQRYLDLTSNRETFERFRLRSLFVRKLREFYWKQGFEEMETPVLTTAASGALATPFVTKHEAYNMDVYLRIATETYLKE